MLFKFKQKTIVVDAFTCDQTVYKTNRIDPFGKKLPEWWKNLPTPSIDLISAAVTQNMRGCVGFTDQFKTSFIYSSPFDIGVSIDIEIPEQRDAVKTFYASSKPDFGQHGEVHVYDQYTGMVDPSQWRHYKIDNPWRFKTKSDIKFFCSDPMYHKTGRGYYALPGMLDFKYNTGMFVNFLFNMENKKVMNYHIEFGQPLYQITPLTEKNVEFKYHLISSSEYKDKFPPTRVSLLHSSRKYRKKSIEIEQKESKCPFGFDKK
jgi:hypothetical protein